VYTKWLTERRAAAVYTAYGVGFARVTGLRRYLQQVRAMFVKLVLHAGRNISMSVAQIATPVFFVTCACLIIMTLPKDYDLPPLYLDLSHYRLVRVPYLAVPGAPYPDRRRRLADCYRDVVVSQVTATFDL